MLWRRSAWAALAVLFAAGPAGAQDASLGRQVWLTKANCRDCHGWAGHGVPDVPQEPNGASLRETQLTPEQLAETIQCGRPGTEMPFFDRRAYTDARCYGLTRADLGDQAPLQGLVGLTPREIAAIVAYIQEAMIGRGAPTFEECVETWGEGATSCPRYPRAGGG